MGRRRHGRRLDEHGDLHAIPAVAAAADEVEPARLVEPEDEVVAAAVAEDGAVGVARRVRRLVHLHHVVLALLVLEFCKQTPSILFYQKLDLDHTGGLMANA